MHTFKVGNIYIYIYIYKVMCWTKNGALKNSSINWVLNILVKSFHPETLDGNLGYIKWNSSSRARPGKSPSNSIR